MTEANTTIRIDPGEGDVVLVIRRHPEAPGGYTAEWWMDDSKMTRAALMAIGLSRLLDDREWTGKLIERTRKKVLEELRAELGHDVKLEDARVASS